MDAIARGVGAQQADRITTLLATYGELAEALAALPAQSQPAVRVRHQLAELADEIERESRACATSGERCEREVG